MRPRICRGRKDPNCSSHETVPSQTNLIYKMQKISFFMSEKMKEIQVPSSESNYYNILAYFGSFTSGRFSSFRNLEKKKHYYYTFMLN